MPRKTKLATRLIAAFSSAATCGTVMAQLAEAPSEAPQRIEITGSAIKRIDAETAVPVTVMRLDDLKKEGVTTIEQVLQMVSAVQIQVGTSQVVGAGTGGASFADLRGIGANKTLILLNGRRIANNALDSSAPDLNMIPFAALERVEVLRDGASSLYGTDAIGGVINFITRKDFTGGAITIGYDQPEDSGGKSYNGNLGLGFGDLNTDGFNVFGFVDFNKQQRIKGTQRPFNTRIPGGISPTPFPANYFQDDASGNPAAPDCTSSPNLISDGGSGCSIATSVFVNYIPRTERESAMLKGTLKINEDHQLGLEYFGTRSEISSLIAPVPYGNLFQNKTLPGGGLNPFYPGNGTVPNNITLNPNYLEEGYTDDPDSGILPGFIHVKWRDLPNGQREDISTNIQQRYVASAEGTVIGWDYQAAFSYNQNRYTQALAGYSDGATINAGVLNGIINPFGDQTAEGADLIASAALEGVLQRAKGTVKTVDARASRELGDWLGAGRAAAIALGGEFRKEKFTDAANPDFATAVIASTGFDPATLNEGDRKIYAAYTELNVPILSTLDVTAAVRYDHYSDFGSTTNPKFSFRFQPAPEVLFRGSFSTGFRAPSLFELNAAQTYTNTSQFDDPVNCPGGNPIPGKPRATNCGQQFQALQGGNLDLSPEKSKNYTLGIVLEPVTDVSVGFDLWWIRFRNSIGAVADTTIFGNPDLFAGSFHRNPQGNLSTDGSLCPDPATCGYIDERTQNLGKTRTNGVDINGSYRLRAGEYGNFGFSTQNTYVTQYEYQDFAGGPFNQNVGVFSGAGPIFRWQNNFLATWDVGMFGVGAAMHHKSDYLDQDPTNRVHDYTTFDLYGSITPIKALSFTLGIKNLTDRDPPFSNQTEVFQAGYDPRFTDPTGRTYYARASYTF